MHSLESCWCDASHLPDARLYRHGLQLWRLSAPRAGQSGRCRLAAPPIGTHFYLLVRTATDVRSSACAACCYGCVVRAKLFRAMRWFCWGSRSAHPPPHFVIAWAMCACRVCLPYLHKINQERHGRTPFFLVLCLHFEPSGGVYGFCALYVVFWHYLFAISFSLVLLCQQKQGWKLFHR